MATLTVMYKLLHDCNECHYKMHDNEKAIYFQFILLTSKCILNRVENAQTNILDYIQSTFFNVISLYEGIIISPVQSIVA